MAPESWHRLRLARDPADPRCGPQCRRYLLKAASQCGHRYQRLRARQFLPLLECLPHLRHLESSVDLGYPTVPAMLPAFQKPNFGTEIHRRHAQNKALTLADGAGPGESQLGAGEIFPAGALFHLRERREEDWGPDPSVGRHSPNQPWQGSAGQKREPTGGREVKGHTGQAQRDARRLVS